MNKTFNVEIDCAVCASKCEEAIKKVEGVIDCSINYITQKMMLSADDAKYSMVLKNAIKAAKKVEDEFEVIF